MNASHRRSSKLGHLFAFSLLFFFGFATIPVMAQGVLEEVIVTAQKREQNLQDVGISITAFTGDQMRALGFERSNDIANFTPGVHIGGALANQNLQYTIRGVTQNDFNDIIESPNAVYLDEGYLALANAQTFALFDIERVEILKGPQGTLFGRNATGGLVHYHSVKPNFDGPEGFLDYTYGLFDSGADADQHRVEGAFGAPINDTLAARVAFLYNQNDGYLENNYPAFTNAFTGGSPGIGAGADLGGEETYAIRGSLLFRPNNDMSLALSGNVARSDLDTGPYQSKSVIGIFNAAPTIAPPGFPVSAFPTPGTGELINVIDTPSNETRLSIIQGTALDGGCDPADVGINSTNCFGASGTRRPVPGGDFFGYNDPDGEEFSFSGDFAFEDQGEVKADGINAKFEYDINERVTITAITDAKWYDKSLFIDVDSAPVNSTANYAFADATSFTQELRFGGETDKTRWLAGFYYLNIDTDSDNGLKIPPNSVLLSNSLLLSPDPAAGIVAGPLPGTPLTGVNLLFFGGAAPAGVDLATEAQLETDSYSLFGQIEYDLTDQVTFTFGLRVIQEEKDYDLTIGAYATSSASTINQGPFIPIVSIAPTANGTPNLVAPNTISTLSGPAFSFSDSSSDTLWAGKVQLDWRPNDDLLLYAGVNRGVKAGSFNSPLIGSWNLAAVTLAAQGRDPNSFIPYKEEVLIAYEGGFKATVWNGKARINGAAFYYDYSDYQAFLFTGIGGNVINADAENVGFELDLRANPLTGLDALFGVSWFDATVKDVPLRIGSSIVRDVDPTYAPELQLNALLRYEWPAFGGKLSIQGDASYSDEFFYNLRNFDADKFDSYVMVNTRLAWASNDGKWEGAFSVRNVTDTDAGILGFDLATACGCNEISFQPPRWFGFNVRYLY